MELKTYFAQDRNGSLIPSASVSIFLTGTSTLASGLTNVSGSPLSNPFTADANGKIQFYAPDGIYDMQVSLGSVSGVKVTFQCLDVQQQLSEATSAAQRAEAAAESVENQAASIEKNSREQWRRQLADVGLTLVDGSFEEGATVNSATDAVWHIAGGQCYTWGGDLPKTVDTGSIPDSSGGISSEAWTDTGGISLRQEIVSGSGAELIGFMQQATSSVKRTLALKLSEVVSITDFITTTSEDVTDSIQAALNYGGALYVPAGEFNVSSPLIVKSNTYIFGEGKIVSNNQTDSVLKLTGISNVAIEGIKITRLLDSNPGGSALSSNILIDACSNISVDNVDSTVSRIGNAIFVTGNSSDVTIDGCLVSADSTAFDPSELQTASTVASPNGIYIDYAHDVRIHGNTCKNIGHGILLQNVTGTEPTRNITVTENNIRGCSSYGIVSYRSSESVHDVIISRNTIEDIYGTYYNAAAPSAPYTHGSGIYGQNVHKHIISENIIKNVCVNTNNFGTLSPAGIGFGSVTGFEITGNIIDTASSNGIICDGSNNIVDDNTIKATSRAAIRFRATDKTSCRGNNIDCTASGTQGVLAEGSSSGSHKYLDVSDNTIVASNAAIALAYTQNSKITDNTIDSSAANNSAAITVSGDGYDALIDRNTVTVASGYGIRPQIKSVVTNNRVKGATSGQSIVARADSYYDNNFSDTSGSGSVFVEQNLASANILTLAYQGPLVRVNITDTTNQLHGISAVPVGCEVILRVQSGVTIKNMYGSVGARFRFADGADKTTTRTTLFTFVNTFSGVLDCVSSF